MWACLNKRIGTHKTAGFSLQASLHPTHKGSPQKMTHPCEAIFQVRYGSLQLQGIKVEGLGIGQLSTQPREGVAFFPNEQVARNVHAQPLSRSAAQPLSRSAAQPLSRSAPPPAKWVAHTSSAPAEHCAHLAFGCGSKQVPFWGRCTTHFCLV